MQSLNMSHIPDENGNNTSRRNSMKDMVAPLDAFPFFDNQVTA